MQGSAYLEHHVGHGGASASLRQLIERMKLLRAHHLTPTLSVTTSTGEMFLATL